MIVCVITSRDTPERLEEFKDRWAPNNQEFKIVYSESAPTFELSCLQAHRKAWKNTPPIAVFEDDAVFAEDFTLDVSPPDDAAIAWLGGEHVTAPIPYNETWVVPTKMLRTHGYIIYTPVVVASEMRRIAANRLDPDMSLLRVPQYALRRWTVGQGPGLSSHTKLERTEPEFWQWEE